jgi:hypothetical protein
MEPPSIREIVENILVFSKFGGCEFDDEFVKSIYLLILDEMDLTENQYRAIMRIYRNFGIKKWMERRQGLEARDPRCGPSRADPLKRE